MNEEKNEITEISSQMVEDPHFQIKRELNRANLKRILAIVVIIISLWGLFYTIFWTVVSLDCWGPAALFGFIVADLAILCLDYLMIRMFRNQGKKVRSLIGELQK